MIQRFTLEYTTLLLTKSALRRTVAVPQSYDPTTILRDTAQSRINTGWKRVHASTTIEEFMHNNSVSFDVIPKPRMTYVVDCEGNTL